MQWGMHQVLDKCSVHRRKWEPADTQREYLVVPGALGIEAKHAQREPDQRRYSEKNGPRKRAGSNVVQKGNFRGCAALLMARIALGFGDQLLHVHDLSDGNKMRRLGKMLIATGHIRVT